MFAIILSIFITICDLEQRQYISEREIRHEIAKVADTLRVEPTDCHIIEKHLVSHPMIRTAEVYLSTQGRLMVSVTQRIPYLRVHNGTEDYLIDTDRKRMPIRPKMALDVIECSGTISEQNACQSLYDLVGVIHKTEALQEHTVQVRCQNIKDITLIIDNRTRVLIGDMGADYAKRLQTLEKLWKEVAMESHKEYDLRFKGQIITR